MTVQTPIARVAIAAPEYENVLVEELGPLLIERRDRWMLFRGESVPVWAQNVWLEPKTFSFQSISQAANHLR